MAIYVDENGRSHGSLRTHAETLRKYPPATFLMRQSTSSYTFDGTKINIPKGVPVWIPVYAIHRDSNIYPNPDGFDPGRFKEEVAESRNTMSYLPFGDGPRKCIGTKEYSKLSSRDAKEKMCLFFFAASRFAVYQTKVGLVKILRKYRIDVCEKTQIPYANDPKAFLLTPRGGIYLRITKINGE